MRDKPIVVTLLMVPTYGKLDSLHPLTTNTLVSTSTVSGLSYLTIP